MKKKKSINTKKKVPKQQKIDVVLASLLNLEIQVKELTKKIDELNSQKVKVVEPNTHPESKKKYWPNDPLDGVQYL